jgi:predicted alpha/beta-hydrolase family hydrolase
VKPVEIETPHGPARAHLDLAEEPVAGLVLGHGAGGGVNAPDLAAVADVGRALGFSVVLVEQPYRVAGRRSSPPADRLDAAWTAVLQHLRERNLRGLRLVAGGRSAGARVACRTADATGASAVLCLAFPVHPPGRAGDPSKSRQHELDSVPVPTLVVQGDRDPFGMPTASPGHEIVTVPGNHSLKGNLDRIASAVRDWLPGTVA